MIKPARPYYHLWHDDHRLLSFDFPLLHFLLRRWGGGGPEENFIPTSSILIVAQVAAKEPSSKPAEMLAGVA